MTVKLIAVDMDGTLLRPDKTVSKRCAEALRGAIDKGAILIPATGRVAYMIPKPVVGIRGVRYAITSNGAMVRDLQERKTLYRNLMTMQQASQLLTFLEARGLFAEAYCDGVSYSEKRMLDLAVKAGLPERVLGYIMESQRFVENLAGHVSLLNLPPEKVNIPYVPQELRAELCGKILSIPGLAVTSSGLENIEVNSASCSKGDALRFLCTRLSVSPSQTMAIGDGDNDISMLQYAGIAVAMGNAQPAVKAAANFVTGANDQDGVAYVIEKLVLTEKHYG